MQRNAFVVMMLRSPLHPLMGKTMLLTVVGRRSGRQITLPVNYIRRGGELWVLTSRSRNWWLNIKGGAPVRLHLHGRELAGNAELITGEKAVSDALVEYVRDLPASAAPLGIHLVDAVPDRRDLQRAASEKLFVKICVKNEGAQAAPRP